MPRHGRRRKGKQASPAEVPALPCERDTSHLSDARVLFIATVPGEDAAVGPLVRALREVPGASPSPLPPTACAAVPGAAAFSSTAAIGFLLR
jgi:hypothetical protein